MTDRPAIFEADFVDLAFKPGLKVARVSFDLPIEYAASFLQAFGAPDRVSPVKCAIARLMDKAPTEAAPKEQDKPRRHLKEMPLSQQCALMCSDPRFIEWLGCETEAEATEVIKSKLRIQSRRELDGHSFDAATSWKAIHTSFELGEAYIR